MLRSSFFRPCAAVLLFAASAFGQSQNATLGGSVTDASGSFVPNASVTIKASDRGFTSTVKTDSDGRYLFPNLDPGNYDLTVEAAGFKSYVSTKIQLLATESHRIDAQLQVGDAATKIEVVADVAQLNVDNGAKAEGVAPTVINQLPLLVSSGTPRNAVQFITFLPGVNTGTSPQAFNARINGGLRMGDEAVLDGVSMQEGTMSQSGMVSFFDFASTPDMVDEVKVLTSSYLPEYGTTTGGELIVTSRHGSDQFHGAAFEYLRNKDLNALQFTNNRPAGDARPKDNENEPGFVIGGPVLIKPVPFIWGSKHKTYFFANLDWLRSLGGASRHVLSIPSAQERTGDFSDLGVPIFDPKTETITNGVISRTPYPGNKIPTSEQSPLALSWMSYLPATTGPGAYNNFLAPPVSDGILSNQNLYSYRIDYNWSDNDRFFASVWRQHNPPLAQCELPLQICSSNPADPEDAWVSRFNWDHIFSPTLLNHMAYGYVNRNEGYGSIPAQKPLPQIPNAVAYLAAPQAQFSASGISNLNQWGQSAGLGSLNKTTRPSHIVNDMVTWVHGAHEIKFGGEFRHLQQVFRVNSNQSGTVGFNDLSTGLQGTPSGDPYASMLVGAVDYGNLNVYNINKYGAEQRAYTWHVGDVWKLTSRLTVNYGIRWDRFTPTFETGNHLAFLSFAPNPDAGNLPGSLAYAGNSWGAASYGKPYPENVFNGGFGPRVGAAYKLDEKTVIRAGYGVFYTQAFYPGWSGGMNLDGFNPAISFGDSHSGYEPSFYLDNGFPAYSKAENVSQGADNGHSPTYRPTYGNHLSYTQQWNLTVERKITSSSFVSVAYVGNKGTHLPSAMQPLNYLNPALLTSMGSTELNTVFQPGQTSLFGVNAPYSGWIQQLTSAGSCAPTVAQALVAYPQFCGGLTGLNENEGVSLYDSLQVNFQKNFSNGVYLQANYTYSRLTTDAASTTQSASAGYGRVGAVINPFQGSRNKSLSTDDIPNTFALMGTYDLPFGSGKKWLNKTGLSNYVFGGWVLATSMKFTSGMPLYFQDSAVCGVPGQFQAQCIPGFTGNVLAQSWGSVNVNQPVYNAAAFEPSSLFAKGNYLGTGPRVTGVRGSPYRDTNLSIAKKFSLKERVNLEFRGEIFNVLNNHYFTCDGQAFGDCIPFNNDPSSASFGVWNGTVSQPRNIQLVGRITF
ncbi:MAG TPA: carboxypeptidase-like regulatory domain-containing protein [Bryobacteraceae bacterium]|nr:carboxypeptidase-like regulatory domain-containing protein [Bryobacteraceae bacterium]